MATRQDEATTDVTALLKAKNTLLWIMSGEELRVERALITVAGGMGMDPRFWDCADGIQNGVGEPIADGTKDPLAALNYIDERKERALYVMRDLHRWISNDPQVLRKLRSLTRKLQGAARNEARAIVLLTPTAEVPPELTSQATVLDWPLPDREEMGTILDGIIDSLSDDLRKSALPKNGAREAAIDAAVGLSADEATNSYAKSIVTTRGIDPAIVSAEKKRVIAKDQVLTWYDPDPRGLDAIGGLTPLKDWLVGRRAAFTPRARKKGLPAPKGVLLVGLPGCGKSLTAKCIATAWGQPLLQLDLGGLKSKYVGESEANIRKALALAETVAPCVLWVDEIEKALAGSTGPQGDGGVGSDALAKILTWMQDHTGSVFVVATANDVSALPGELLRKGRFDERFFVDLPTSSERLGVLKAALGQYGLDFDAIVAADDDDVIGQVLFATEGFTGAEIAAVIPDAMYAAFGDGERDVAAVDVLAAAKTVTPQFKADTEKVKELREWAKGKARNANAPDAPTTTRRKAAARNIEL